MAYNSFELVNTRTLKRITSQNKKKSVYLSKNYPTEEERTLIKKGYNHNNRSDNEIDAILKDIYPSKGNIIKMWYNFKVIWRPYHFINEYKPWPSHAFDKKNSFFKFGGIKVIGYGTLLPFVILSIFIIIQKREKEAYIILFPIVIQTILHMLSWAQGRYRSHIDTFVIILGCYGMVVIYNFVCKKIRQPVSVMK